MEPINREKIESKHLEGQLGPRKYQKSGGHVFAYSRPAPLPWSVAPLPPP